MESFFVTLVEGGENEEVADGLIVEFGDEVASFAKVGGNIGKFFEFEKPPPNPIVCVGDGVPWEVWEVSKELAIPGDHGLIVFFLAKDPSASLESKGGL